MREKRGCRVRQSTMMVGEDTQTLGVNMCTLGMYEKFQTDKDIIVEMMKEQCPYLCKWGC